MTRHARSPRRPRRLALAVLLGVAGLAAGCHRDPGRLVGQPIQPGREWAATLHRDHPLVGRIWDVRKGAFTDEAALDAAVRGAELLLLGETHDNPDHHVLQARLLRTVTAAGRAPAVAFEMLSVEQQAAIDAARAGKRAGPDDLARAVSWDQSGWPAFRMYRPVFSAAFDAGLPIAGANLPRLAVRDVVRKGVAALPPPVKARIDRQPPLGPEEARALREEMQESHCGELPEKLLDPMVLGQRARDAQMAEALEAAAGARGAVLIAGAGHARTDRGVPAYLEPGRRGSAVSVGFREVEAGEASPAAYAEVKGAPLPYDFVIFTPAAEREDPCAGIGDRIKAGEARDRKRAEQQAPAVKP